jgi:hypothetical protein
MVSIDKMVALTEKEALEIYNGCSVISAQAAQASIPYVL